MILLRECTKSSDAKNYYQCLNDRVEQRMRNDLRCNIPFNVLNKVNEDMPICTTKEDFKEGMTLCPNYTIYKVKKFSITVMYNLEHEVFLEELASNPNCKPDCESWSYQVTKATHFTKKGDLLSYHISSCTEYFCGFTATNATFPDYNGDFKGAWFWLNGPKVKVEEEYVVYSFSGIVGTVGGSMGLFVGFSFLDCLFLGVKRLANMPN